MTDEIDRIKAQEIIARNKYTSLTDQESIDIVLAMVGYFPYDNEEQVKVDISTGDLPHLEDKVIKVICTLEINKPNKELFKPLIMDYLIYVLNRVQNSYLEDKLKSLGYNYTIVGEPEATGVCPCCNYLSIGYGYEGFHDICPICGWQNGGDGPNHMALFQAQGNFIEYGARAVDVIPNELKQPEYQVDSEELNKYKKSD